MRVTVSSLRMSTRSASSNFRGVSGLFPTWIVSVTRRVAVSIRHDSPVRRPDTSLDRRGPPEGAVSDSMTDLNRRPA